MLGSFKNFSRHVVSIIPGISVKNIIKEMYLTVESL